MPQPDSVETLPSATRIPLHRERMVWRRTLSLRSVLLGAAPVLIAAGLFKLAISDGGRDPQTLTLVQTALFVSTACYLWAGITRRVAVAAPLLGMTAAVAVTALGSVRPDSSVRELLLWMTYACIFVLVASTLGTRAAARRFLDALVVIAGWVALVGFYLFWGANNPGMRWFSTFYWPNPFAAFLLLVIPVELSRLVHARGLRETLVHAAMTLLLAVPFVLTYSRGAWVTLLAVMPLAFLLFRPSSRLATLVRLALTAAVLVAVVVLLTRGAALQASPQAVLGRAVSVANANDNSIQGRLNFWRSGLDMFLDHPLLGIGPGTFAYAHATYQRDVRHYARDAHSLYVQTAAEMGMIGLIPLGALLFALVTLCRRTLHQSRQTPEYPLVAGICVGLAAFFGHSALEMNWPFPVNGAMAFSFAAVLATYDRHARGEATVRMPSTASRWWRWPIIAALVLAVVPVQLLEFARQQSLAALNLVYARRWPDAAISLRAVSRLNPLDPKAPSGLAAVSERLGADRGEVIAFIRRSMALDSMNAFYVVQLAEVTYRGAGTDPSAPDQAAALLKQALALDPYHYPNAYGLLARLYAESGQTRRAEDVYREAHARYGRAVTEDGVLQMMLWPGVAQLYLEWAQFLIREGRLPDAAAVYGDILDLDPRYAPAYLRGADLFLRQRRVNDAVALLERGLQNAPASEMLWRRWRELSVGRSAIWPQ